MTVQDWLGADNQLGIDIWHKKYQNGDETFEEWLDRVTGGNQNIRKLIIEKKFLFAGRILANRGLNKEDRKVTYSNCYVTTTNDSIEDIFETAKKIARTFSYGGGIGVDISNLAPRGAKVHNSARESTGAVSFMDLYSLVTGLIGQNGRRGALMLSMSSRHPDIEEFINVKNDLDKVNYANISVRVDNAFMQAVKDDADYELSFTRPETGETISKTVRAKELFRKIAESNWRTGEPGMLFWDTVENYNLLSTTEGFSYAGTNPCGEEPLPEGGSCCLSSMNLAAYVVKQNGISYFDITTFKRDVRWAVAALNEVLDEGLPLHPLQEQRDSVAKWRQIGLGVMGLADALIKMGIRYGSHEAVEICDSIGRAMANSALQESAMLASIKGSYPAFDRDAVLNTSYLSYVSDFDTLDLIYKHGLRNSQLLTAAPTGTLSTMLGVSGGIEPVFANFYSRTTKSLHNKDVTYKVYTPIVQQYMDTHGLTDESELPDYFITAQQLDFKERIAMQAVWQEYIDASISSTVNVPNDFTVEDIEELYMLAWQKGLKGITLFRDGCERAAILNTGITQPESEPITPTHNVLGRGDVIMVNDDVVGLKRKLMTGCGTLHCTAFFDPATGDLLETYISKGSTGGCLNSLTGLSRMISLSSRAGVSIYDIVDQLDSSGVCPSYAVRRAVHGDTSPGSSCPVAIGRALLDMYNEMQSTIEDEDYTEDNTEDEMDACVNVESAPALVQGHACPECGAPLQHEGGCDICKNCGYSRCG